MTLELHAPGESLPGVPGPHERDVAHDDADRAEVVDHDLADHVVGLVGVRDPGHNPGHEAQKEDRDDRIEGGEKPAHA